MATYAADLKVQEVGSTASAAGKRRAVRWILLVLAAASIPYIDSLRYGFVYDDEAQVLGMAAIRSWSFVPGYFFRPIQGFIARYYRPIFFLWFRLNYFLWNTHAWGWHLTNILLHMLASLLVLALLRRYFNDARCAIAGALVFAVHPAHVETVAWVSGCTDALMAVSLLGSFLLWMENCEAPSLRRRIGSLACCAVALLSKETAVILPILIFFHAVAGIPAASAVRGSGKRTGFALREAAPYAGIAAAYLAVRYLVLRGMPGTPNWISHARTILTMPSLLLFYASHLIWPMKSSIFYDFPTVGRAASPSFWVPLLVLAGLAAGLWFWFRRSKDSRIIGAALWFLVPIGPVLYIRMFQPDEFVHDRYLYLPVLAFSILTGMLCEFLWKAEPGRKASALPSLLVTVAVVSLGLGTAAQAQPWQSNLSLYRHALQIAPKNAMARNNLASEYIADGQYQEAGDVLRALLGDRPDMWLANYNYGYLNYTIGNFILADEYLHRAIRIDPQDADQYVYLGATYFKEGRLKEAAQELRQGIAHRPDGARYHFILGLILLEQRDLVSAKTEMQAELKNDPGNSTVRGQIEAINKQLAIRGG